MGFFNFIETFFFLSLGITFVLILLLVYHFKQRLTTLENKCDTVYEIITNLVKEVSNIRQVQMHQISNQINTFTPSFHNTEVNGKIKVSDEDFEEASDEEEEEESGSESGEDSDGDDASDDDVSDDDMPPLINIEEPLSNSTIKVINVEIGDSIESDILDTEVESENIDNDETDRLEPIELQDEDEQIHVEKLEETAALENNESDSTSKETAKDVYGKMSVSELKALVITKGLSSDPSKKKKHELLKLLESAEN
jgi:hypothetical protein